MREEKPLILTASVTATRLRWGITNKIARMSVIVTTCVLPLLGYADGLPVMEDARLLQAYHSNRIWNGVATTRDGRVFASFPSFDRTGPQLQELTSEATAVPWPNAAWNSRKPGGGTSAVFVHVNAVRIGPDGKLWVVDSGAEGLGAPPIPGASRLFRFDISTRSVDHVYSLDAGLKPASFIDDVRFNGRHAYLTDVGSPGLLVLDLKTGLVRRVLDQDPSTTDFRPMIADGRVMRDEHGHELRVHADQIEVSPNGRYAYFQPASGPLARVETRWLDDPTIAPERLSASVERNWVNTPTSGGTAIDSHGNIYMGDAERRLILRIAPDKTVTTIAADPRFVWTDAMWIDHKGFLWIPATQLNRTAVLNGGKAEVNYPVWLFKLPIGAKPPANDHP